MTDYKVLLIIFAIGLLAGFFLGFAASSILNPPTRSFTWCNDRSKVKIAYKAGMSTGYDYGKGDKCQESYQDGFEDGKLLANETQDSLSLKKGE